MEKSELKPQIMFEEKEQNEPLMKKLRKLSLLPRNSFIGKAGRVVMVSAIVGFSVLGAVDAVAMEVRFKDSEKSVQVAKGSAAQEIPLYVNSDDDSCNFTCVDYKDCTVDIGCVLDLPCESVQVPCIYGVYLPEW